MRMALLLAQVLFFPFVFILFRPRIGFFLKCFSMSLFLLPQSFRRFLPMIHPLDDGKHQFPHFFFSFGSFRMHLSILRTQGKRSKATASGGGGVFLFHIVLVILVIGSGRILWGRCHVNASRGQIIHFGFLLFVIRRSRERGRRTGGSSLGKGWVGMGRLSRSRGRCGTKPFGWRLGRAGSCWKR